MKRTLAQAQADVSRAMERHGDTWFAMLYHRPHITPGGKLRAVWRIHGRDSQRRVVTVTDGVHSVDREGVIVVLQPPRKAV